MKIHRENPFEKDAEEILSKDGDLNELIAEHVIKKGMEIPVAHRLVETINVKNFIRNHSKKIEEFPLADKGKVEALIKIRQEESTLAPKKAAETLDDSYFICEEIPRFLSGETPDEVRL